MKKFDLSKHLLKHDYEILQGTKIRKDGTVAVYYYIEPIEAERVPGLVVFKSMFPHHDPKQIIRMLVTYHRKMDWRARLNMGMLSINKSPIILHEIHKKGFMTAPIDRHYQKTYGVSCLLERGNHDLDLMREA